MVNGIVNSDLGNDLTANTNNLSAGKHSIQVKLTSSIACAINKPATSIPVSTTLNNSPIPTIMITNINTKLPIIFSIADCSNLGKKQNYQWYLNGAIIPNANSSSYTTSTTSGNSDDYALKVTSSMLCTTPPTIMSNYRTIAIALPIILKSFSANVFSEDLNLAWQTSSEINTDRFEILRKFQDSSSFVVIGNVNASNNVNGSSYSLNDQPQQTGTYQYQLKNYDFDGNFQTSNAQSVYLGSSNNLVNKVFPNPFNDKLIISLKNVKMQEAYILFYNTNGQVVLRKNIQLINGSQNVEINNLSNIASGLNIIKLYSQSNAPLADFKAIKL